jgi:hypothetical protein
MSRFEGYSFRMGVIATSASDEKQWYGLNFVGFGDAPGLSSKEYQPHFGFAARPVDADADGVGCNGLFTNSGGFSWLAHDPRYNAKCPELSQGSSVHWCADGSHVLLDAVTGEITVKHFAGTKIVITATGITITGAGGTLDYVAQAAKVDKALADLAVHTHGSGVGPTTPPSPPYLAPASVACTTLRTE